MSFKQPDAEELAGVQRLKELIARAQPPIQYTFGDTTLLRFYRGRKGIEEDAFKAIVKHAHWRDEHDVDNITKHINLFQREMDAKKFVVKGFDKSERPAIFIYAGKHNKNDRDLEEIRLLIIFTMETILLRTKPEEERITICFDLTGFKLSCMDYDMVQILIRTLEFNYPETLSTSFIINAPFMFYACWAVIRPWLDPVTAAKVSFINADKLPQYISFETPKRLQKAHLQSDSTAYPDNDDCNSTVADVLVKVVGYDDFDSVFNHKLNPDNPFQKNSLVVTPAPSDSSVSAGNSNKKKGWLW